MRYFKYLFENEISKALDLGDPHVGAEYPPEKVERYVEIIDKAIKVMKGREENDSNDAIVADLLSKRKKWLNMKKETKPTKTKLEIPPEQEEEPEPEQEEEEEQNPPEQKESKLNIILKEMAYKKGNKADKIVNKIVWEWEEWYFDDMPIKELVKELKKEFKTNDKESKFILDVWMDFMKKRINMGEFKEFVHDILQGNKYYGP